MQESVAALLLTDVVDSTRLAEELGISQPLVGKWEADLSIPDREQVAALAVALGVRPELFFVDRSRRLASMSDFYHRALTRASRRDVKAIHARCSIIDIQVDRLLAIADLPDDRIPEYDPDDFDGDVDLRDFVGFAETSRG